MYVCITDVFLVNHFTGIISYGYVAICKFKMALI